jgi:diguanylate cyclase (GGDEF)-like protein
VTDQTARLYTGELDLTTLLLVTAVVIGFSGTFLPLACGRTQEKAAINLWGAAMIMGAAGLLLVAVDQDGLRHIGDVGQALFLAACASTWTASRLFTGLAPRIGLAAAGPGLLLLASRLAPPGWLTLAAVCLIGAAYTAASAVTLWNGRAEPLPSRGPAVAMLLLHAAIYVSRGLAAVLVTDLGAFAQPVAVLILLEALLHTVGLSYLLLAMLKERVERRSGEHLRALALFDGLTGLPNRRTFDGRLEAEIDQARRSRRSLALLLIDVDHFKQFNDCFGHLAGDACLRSVAGGIAAAVASPDSLAARYGGEEFAVVLPSTGAAAAHQAAEAIRAAIERLAIPHATRSGVVTVSIGAASVVPQRDMPGAALIARADEALYEAKAAGRNTVRPTLAAPPPAAPHLALVPPDPAHRPAA